MSTAAQPQLAVVLKFRPKPKRQTRRQAEQAAALARRRAEVELRNRMAL